MMIITQKITSLAYEIHDGKSLEMDLPSPLRSPAGLCLWGTESALLGRGGGRWAVLSRAQGEGALVPTAVESQSATVWFCHVTHVSGVLT